MRLEEAALVVVPGLGVGEVGPLQEVDLGDVTVRCFPVDMASKGVFWVPEDRVDDQGLRAPMDEETAATVIEKLASAKAPEKRASWRTRQKRYETMLASNDPVELAALVGELAAVRADKRSNKQALSFSERRLFERARNLLFGELHAVTGRAIEALERVVLQPAAA